MAGTFSLEIVTPERLLYSGEVVSLRAPGLDGLFGVLHNRAPLLAGLAAGPVSFTLEDGQTRHIAISGGFFEVAANKAMLLADSAQFAEDIDAAEAEAKLEAAKAARGELTTDQNVAEQAQKAVEVAQAWVDTRQLAQR